MRMRKTLIVVGVVVALLVAVVAALPFLIDANQYRSRIQTELEARTGRAVSLGPMELKIFPLAFRVQNAVIAEDKSFVSSAPFAHIEELYVTAQLMPLLQGKVQVDSLELRKPRIEMIRNAKGVWNFSSLGNRGATTAPPPQGKATSTPPQPAPSPAEAGRSFTLDDLRIIDGQVALTDFQKKQPRAIYDHIDLTVLDYAPNTPVTFELAAHLPGAGKQTLWLKGKGGPMQPSPAATPFDGKLELEEVSLSGLQKFLNSQALKDMDFTATGSADVKNANGIIATKGQLKLDNGKVNGVTIGYPISADFNITADTNTSLYKIEKGDFKLGATPIQLHGMFNANPTPAQIDMVLKANDASISEAARLASAFGVAFNPGMQVAGKMDADLTAKGSSTSPELNGKLSARQLVISGKDLPQAVQVTGINLALTPYAITSNEFVATTGTTAVNVSFGLENYTADAASIDAIIRTQNAQLGELLNIAQAYGISAADGIGGSGPTSLDVRVQGRPKVPSSMQYSGSGTLRNGSILLPAFTKPINVRNANIRFTQNSAVIENLGISLGSTIASGQMSLKGLTPKATPQIQFTLNADHWNVAEWQALMRTAAVPAKAAGNFNLIPVAHAQAGPQEAPLIERLIGTGNITINSVKYDEIEMSNARSTVTLDRGMIRLSPFTAEVFGGQQIGNIVINLRTNPSTYTVSSRLERVDANKMLASISSADKILYGLLAANADTTFVAGESSNFARTLNGKINLNLLNGKIANMDLLYELASIGKFLQSGKQSEPFTNVARLTGDFDVKNGIARTDNLNALIDGGSMAARGAVNLVDQTLDLQVTAVLSQGFSQSVGGTGIGGYLNTALANTKGELVMPVNITGSFSKPKITPDLQRLAKMRLENLVPSSGNPGAFTTGILDAIMGKKQPPANADPNAPQPPQQKGGLGGILDALGGKTQQPTQPPPPQGSTTGSEGIPNPSQQAGDPNAQPQQPPPAKSSNPMTDILNAVQGAQKKKQPTPPPPPPEEKKDPPPPAP